MMTELSLMSLVLSLLLLAIPAVALYLYDRSLLIKGTGSVLRMLVQLAVGGLLTYVVFRVDQLFVSLLWVLGITVAATFGVARYSRLALAESISVYFGLLLSTLLVALYLLLCVARQPHPFQTTFLIPVVSILLAHASTVVGRGMCEWLERRQTDRPQYEYLRGNGATHLKALTPLISQVLRKAIIPSLPTIRVTGLFALPLLFSALLLGGIAPLQALIWTVSLFAGSMASSVLALALSLWLMKGKIK